MTTGFEKCDLVLADSKLGLEFAHFIMVSTSHVYLSLYWSIHG